MNKVKKFLCCALCLIIAMGAMAGCSRSGSEYDEKIDPNKTQIYVSAFNGGYGLAWLRSVKKDFETDHPEYQIIISAEKNEMKTLSDMISGKTGNNNIYITSGSQYVKELVELDCLLDLSDIFDGKAADSETMTIKEKMYDSDIHKNTYSKRDGSGIYTFPYTKGFTGIVFDADLFIERGWLEFATQENDGAELTSQGITYTSEDSKLVFQSADHNTNYSEGDYILTKGRDGKYGTYDDGQPTTLEDLELMFEQIKASNKYNPFIYSTDQPDYVNNVVASIFATYEGIDDYTLFYSFDGNYSRTGDLITPETGYKVYDMDGFRESAKFAHDFISPQANNADVIANGVTFTEAQNNFILAHRIGKSSNKAGVMLIDGIWWENEARSTFDDLAKSEPNRGFGKRDYRYLIYPEMDGARGIDGNGNGCIYTAYEEGLVFIDKNKTTDESLRNACKEFIKYTCRDKYLIEASKVGCIRPYKFNATAEYSSMTSFVRNVNEMFSDTDNIKIISTAQLQSGFDLSFYGLTSATLRWNGYPAALFYNQKNLTIDNYVRSQKTYFQNNWSGYVNKMNNIIGA